VTWHDPLRALPKSPIWWHARESSFQVHLRHALKMIEDAQAEMDEKEWEFYSRILRKKLEAQ
jgi:hypothetical protein